MSNNGWIDAQPPRWKPEKEGEFIEGEYGGWELVKFDGREAKLYTLYGNDAPTHTFWGSAMLDRLLGPLGMGVRVRVTYLGWVTARSGRPMRNYKVEIRR